MSAATWASFLTKRASLHKHPARSAAVAGTRTRPANQHAPSASQEPTRTRTANLKRTQRRASTVRWASTSQRPASHPARSAAVAGTRTRPANRANRHARPSAPQEPTRTRTANRTMTRQRAKAAVWAGSRTNAGNQPAAAAAWDISLIKRESPSAWNALLEYMSRRPESRRVPVVKRATTWTERASLLARTASLRNTRTRRGHPNARAVRTTR